MDHAKKHSKPCPRCSRSELLPAKVEAATMDVCARCAGMWCSSAQWLDDVHGSHKSLQALTDHELSDEVPDEQAINEDIDDFSVVNNTPLQCPDCNREMLELSLGNPTFTVIEQCKRCGGIWLDHLEDKDLMALKSWSAHHDSLKTELTRGNWWFQFLSQLPVEFNLRPHRTPWVTWSLIAICIAVFVFQQTVDAEKWFFYAHSPALFQANPYSWTPLTSMFMHADWLHLLGNMYFLWLFGDNLEDAFGHVLYACFYLLCGFAALFAFHFLNLDSNIPLMGASGAISGLMAGYILLFRHAKLSLMILIWQQRISAVVWVAFWIIFNIGMMVYAYYIAESTGGGVAWSAHVFGFVAGAVLVLPFRKRIMEKTPVLRVMEWGESRLVGNLVRTKQ